MRPYSAAIVAGFVWLVACWSRAEENPPPDQQVTYYVHEVPGDPESAVVLEVSFSLSATAVDGNSVGWRIDQTECRQPLDGGTTKWVEMLPLVQSTDGLWWVTHSDPATPLASEFAEPPLVQGTAQAQAQGEAELEYRFAGTAGSSIPGARTAQATFAFRRANLTEPIAEGTEEPVEIDDPRPPSST